MVLVGGDGASELKDALKKMANKYGVPCFADAGEAAKSICSGSSAKTASPAKQVYVDTRAKFHANETLLAAASAWQRGELDGPEAVEKTEVCQEQKLKGMLIKPLKLKNPIFTHFVESSAKPRPPTVFYEDDKMLIFPNVKVSRLSCSLSFLSDGLCTYLGA